MHSLEYFHPLAAMNKLRYTAMNFGVQISAWAPAFNSFEYIAGGGIAESWLFCI